MKAQPRIVWSGSEGYEEGPVRIVIVEQTLSVEIETTDSMGQSAWVPVGSSRRASILATAVRELARENAKLDAISGGAPEKGGAA